LFNFWTPTIWFLYCTQFTYLLSYSWPIKDASPNKRLEIWNLSSRVHIWYLTRSLLSLVRYQCEHSKINSISPRAHVLFSIYFISSQFCWLFSRELKVLCTWYLFLFLIFLSFSKWQLFFIIGTPIILRSS